MNNEEVRSVFHDALGGMAPLPGNDTDDIVAAGRKVVGRRRAWRTGGAVAGVAALLVLTGFALQQGGPSTVEGAAPLGSASPSQSTPLDEKGEPIPPPDTRVPDPTGQYIAALKATVPGALPDTVFSVPTGAGREEVWQYTGGSYNKDLTIQVGADHKGDRATMMIDVRREDEKNTLSGKEYLSEEAKCGASPCIFTRGPNGEWIATRGEQGYLRSYVLRADKTIVMVELDMDDNGPVWAKPEWLSQIGLAMPVAPLYDK